jgi:large repetitive protein
MEHSRQSDEHRRRSTDEAYKLGAGWVSRFSYLVLMGLVFSFADAAAQTGVSYIANTNDNTVTVTNGFDAVFGPRFQLTIPVGTKPVGIATNSKFAYVTNSGDNTVSVVDTGSNVVTQTLAVGKNPTGVAASESFAYVTNSDDGTVSIVDVTNGNKVLPTALTVGKTPVAVAIAPAPNGSVLVANSGDNTISVISNNTVIGNPIQVGKQPSGIAISNEKNGEFAYVTNAGDNTVSILVLPSSPTGTITVQNPPLAVGLEPTGIGVFSPLLFVANTGSSDPPTVSAFASDSTTAAAPPTETAFSPLSLVSQTSPKGIAFTNDGLAVFVTTPGSNNAAVISGFGEPGISTISTGNNPNGVAVTPNDPAVCAVGSVTVNDNSVYSCPSGSSSLCDPLPTLVVPAGATVNATVSCSNSAAQEVFNGMTLNFGTGTNCIGGNNPNDDTGPCLSGAATDIGGQTTFPASGVFTIQGTAASSGSSGSVNFQALVGANCTLAVPTLVQANQPLSPSLTCTAPPEDGLSATLNWGDGATSTGTGTGAGSTPIQLTFVPPSHSYASAGSATVSATVTDTTEKSTAAVTPTSGIKSLQREYR